MKKKPVAAKDENKEKILAFAERITEWLERSAAKSKQQAAANRGRFDSLADACEADARNFLAMAKEGRSAIADALSRRAVVAVVLLMIAAAPLHAEESRVEVASVFGSLVYADVLTTEMILADAQGIEHFGLFRSRAVRIAGSSAQVALVAWGVPKLSKTHPRRAKFLKYGLYAYRVLAPTLNAYNAIQHERREASRIRLFLSGGGR